MGMVTSVQRLKDETIDRLLAEPPLIWRLLAPDDPDIYLETAFEASDPGFFAKLLGKKPSAAPTEAPDLQLSEDEGADAYLDKAWHGLHFLLTGKVWEGDPPLGFLICGGRSVGDIDVGYGPARAFRSPETLEIAEALKPIDEAEIKARFDPAAMTKADIYPEIWESEPEESLEYILENYEDLKHLVDMAAANNQGLIITCS